MPVEHAVIAHIKLSDDNFGEAAEREAVYALEERRIEAIEGAAEGEFDGNEFGGGEAVLHAQGPDADDLFRVMGRDLRAFGARPAWCLLRYGAAGDLTAKELRIDL